MTAYNESEMNERLLKSATKAFNEKGFRAASLRDICADADVTTGYLYSHYRSKKDLFRAIVGDVAGKIESGMEAHFKKYINDVSEYSTIRKEVEIILYLYPNRDKVILLFERAKGTEFEDFGRKLFKRYLEQFIEFYNRIVGVNEDPVFLEVICRMRFQSYSEILHRELDPEQLLVLAGKVGRFKAAGLLGMKDMKSLCITREIVEEKQSGSNCDFDPDCS